MADPATENTDPSAPANPTPKDPSSTPDPLSTDSKKPEPEAETPASSEQDTDMGQRIAGFERQLAEQEEQSRKLRDELAQRDREAARKDVLLKHPELDEEDLELCGETDPKKIGEWGDRYAERQAEHAESSRSGHANQAVNLARQGAWSNQSPKTTAKSSERDEAYEQAKKKYAHNNQ